jgi:hypothetical protein
MHQYVDEQEQEAPEDADQKAIPLEDKPTLRAIPTFSEEPTSESIPLGERPTFRELPAATEDPEPQDEEE